MADEPEAPQPQPQPEPPPLPQPPPPKRQRDWGDEPEPKRRAERPNDSGDEFDDEFDDDRPRRSRRGRQEQSFYDREPRSGWILGLGIASIAMLSFCPFLPLPLSVTAWVMANNELRAMDAGEVDERNRSTTKAGKVCAIIGFILGLMYFVFIMAYFGLIIGVVALK